MASQGMEASRPASTITGVRQPVHLHDEGWVGTEFEDSPHGPGRGRRLTFHPGATCRFNEIRTSDTMEILEVSVPGKDGPTTPATRRRASGLIRHGNLLAACARRRQNMSNAGRLRRRARRGASSTSPGRPCRLLVRPARRQEFVVAFARRRGGAAFRGRQFDLKPGDWLDIPAHVPPSRRLDPGRSAHGVARRPSEASRS